MNRPDLDPALPRYTIRYLAEEGGWKLSKWKMTIAYAVKQYAGLEWDPVMESEEYIDPKDMPIVNGNSASHLLRGPKG